MDILEYRLQTIVMEIQPILIAISLTTRRWYLQSHALDAQNATLQFVSSKLTGKWYFELFHSPGQI